MGRESKEQIAVIGLGFVGLTTALGFAAKGFKVLGFDVSADIRKSLQEQRLRFHEPHLAEQLKRLSGKRFFVASSLAEAVAEADVIFYCVGTPARPSGEADVSFLTGAIVSTLKSLPAGRRPTLVVKSTVPPGTVQRKICPLFKKAGLVIGSDIGFANNPEFLREGFAWEDFTRPDRVVIGANDSFSFEAVAALYAGFRTTVCRVSPTTAEFIKSTSNALLATLISFANEASMVADQVGDIDIKAAFQNLHMDRRWSGQPARMTSYLFPGCGFGGYCLPKDTAALLYTARSNGLQAKLLRGVIAVNREIKEHFVRKIVAATGPRSRIGILGLSFKPGSDDVRDSPAAEVIRLLLQAGRRRILAYDPLAMEVYRKVHDQPIGYARDLKDLVAQSDALAVLTAWPEFKENKALFSGKPVFDGRYCL
jgi:UDPglucose 6-dehydrogenase